MASINSGAILDDWKTRLVGQLDREERLDIRVFRCRLMDGTKLDILKAHRFARQMVGEELAIFRFEIKQEPNNDTQQIGNREPR